MNRPKAEAVWLFTNRNCMVFDKAGHQLPELQSAICSYRVDLDTALLVCGEANVFVVSRWGEWAHQVTRREMEYLLGLRTQEMDVAERNGDAWTFHRQAEVDSVVERDYYHEVADMMAASWSVGKWVDRETIIKRLRDRFASEEELRTHLMAQTAKVSLMMEELEQLGLEFMGLVQEDLPPRERH